MLAVKSQQSIHEVDFEEEIPNVGGHDLAMLSIGMREYVLDQVIAVLVT